MVSSGIQIDSSTGDRLTHLSPSRQTWVVDNSTVDGSQHLGAGEFRCHNSSLLGPSTRDTHKTVERLCRLRRAVLQMSTFDSTRSKMPFKGLIQATSQPPQPQLSSRASRPIIYPSR